MIKNIGQKIITFVAQIENFQKKLFEKKKFVTETQYCITIANIPEKFYEQIAQNDDQWTEWKELFHIDEEQKNLFNSNAKTKKDKRVIFLKVHPTLVLDTKHFSSGFVDELLTSFEDIDEATDGLVIHGENFQALNLLTGKYSGQIKCIHIDPPYNTQTSGFFYKNNYQHSSWLAMMENRIAAGIPLMSPGGSYLCHIDENEYEVLHLLCTHIGIQDSGTIVWDKKNPMLGRKGIATQHEYILWRTQCESPIYLKPTNVRIILAKAKSLTQKHGGVNDEVRREFAVWISNCEGLTGGDRAYRFIDDDGRVFRGVAMGAPEPRTDPKFHIPLVHPVTKKECPVPSNGWSRAPKTLQDLMEKNEILFGKDETVQPQRKVLLTDESKRQLSSVISDAKRGKADVVKLGLEFPYCHPVSLYEELLGAAASDSNDMVLDYFAGSGTTANAVINLNREDAGCRKFVLAEVDDCVETVLLPRIKKVTFSPEWKDGKPKRMATREEAERSPRIVKYQRIESYEDALNNISFESSDGQTQLMKFDDYLLNYMLEFETKGSATFLNIEKLASPFFYKLQITEGQETRGKVVDLPETFNYLLGLHVMTRKVYDDKGRKYLVYRGTVDHKEVAVIWRETKGWGKKDLERDKKFVADKKLTEGADEIFVNGDSFIPKARALDPVFKARMFEGVQ
ncbi:MAG TPA: DNA methyltransferase [Sedimentisphaerales bacterium]|nr:DNA methyltransferase [Sedimentisphaerales bacterium]